MSPLPDHRPKQLSLGPLETEILNILWKLQSATTKEIHDQILSDPNRELSQASVTTILNRLLKKGWVSCNRQEKAFRWRPTVSQKEASILKSHAQLKQFLAVSSPDLVAAFADSLDEVSLEKFEAIAEKVRAARQAREE